mgnify:CR=1 FL=1
MLSVLALSALGAVEQCTHNTIDCSDAGTCTALTDQMLNHKCVDGGTMGINYNCAGTTVKLEYYSATDCSTDVSATCDIAATMLTGSMPTDCHLPFEIDECKTLIQFGGIGMSIKYKGSCPAAAAEDEPCFSREAEACRVLDTSVAPSAAFRACFDEPAPTVAERVKMTALTGGDYVLSAGKDQAYEFTRVIVNQHKLNEARRRHTRPPPPP